MNISGMFRYAYCIRFYKKTNDNNNFKTGYKKGDLTLSHEYFLKTILERLCITQNIDNIDCTLKGEFELLRVNDSKT